MKGHADFREIFALEEEGDDLCGLRQDALCRLTHIPLHDLSALRTKARLAYEEVLRFSDDRGLISAIFADLERLGR